MNNPQTEIDALKAEAKAITEKIYKLEQSLKEPEKEYGLWRPKLNQDYWIATSIGPQKYTNHNTEADKWLIEHDFISPTKEAAEADKQWRKDDAELRDIIARCNKGWEHDGRKFHCFPKIDNGKVYLDSWNDTCTIPKCYRMSEEAGKEFIKTCPIDLLRRWMERK